MPAGGGGAAVVIQIELGGWLTCRIWDGMRSLGTVWRIGRSPMEYSMEHSVSSAVVASEYSPPPMCELGRSAGQISGSQHYFWGNIRGSVVHKQCGATKQ